MEYKDDNIDEYAIKKCKDGLYDEGNFLREKKRRIKNYILSKDSSFEEKFKFWNFYLILCHHIHFFMLKKDN